MSPGEPRARCEQSGDAQRVPKATSESQANRLPSTPALPSESLFREFSPAFSTSFAEKLHRKLRKRHRRTTTSVRFSKGSWRAPARSAEALTDGPGARRPGTRAAQLFGHEATARKHRLLSLACSRLPSLSSALLSSSPLLSPSAHRLHSPSTLHSQGADLRPKTEPASRSHLRGATRRYAEWRSGLAKTKQAQEAKLCTNAFS